MNNIECFTWQEFVDVHNTNGKLPPTDEIFSSEDVAGNTLKLGDEVWYGTTTTDADLKLGTIVTSTIKRELSVWTAGARFNYFYKQPRLALRMSNGMLKRIGNNCVKR